VGRLQRRLAPCSWPRFSCRQVNTHVTTNREFSGEIEPARPGFEAGVSMERISVFLGHSSIQVPEKHYSPWVRARQEQVEAVCQALLGSGPFPRGKGHQPVTQAQAGTKGVLESGSPTACGSVRFPRSDFPTIARRRAYYMLADLNPTIYPIILNKA
jgi:hypothetical protein